ncbi:MAG: translation initiation factor [Prevotellaceae bacterium]|jgi:translation initiation factor 1|nr:translation initiation factor [Prevotellaceae bacterium]
MSKERKERINVVYSTNPDYNYEYDVEEEVRESIAPAKQNLTVRLDKKQRGGKKVTLVQGFAGAEDDLKDLGKSLKTRCGVGGTVKDGEILIQGDFRDKIVEYLVKEGYKAKRGN